MPSASSESVEVFTGPTQQRMKRGEKWKVDGISVDKPGTFLFREDLVQKSIALARQGSFLVVGSPPGTGKTSLTQLIQEKLKKENQAAARGKILGFSLRPSQLDGFNLFDWVDENTGVSFKEGTVNGEAKGCSEVWLLFDDAQRLYADRHTDFWEQVVKRNEENQKAFGETTVLTVVFATYYLSTKESPVCFRNQNRLAFGDLLMSEEEAKRLFELRCMHPEWLNYFQRLFYLTKGAAAAFTIGLNLIVSLTETVDRRSEDEELTETAALTELIEKTPFGDLDRCFPTDTVDLGSHKVILDAIVDAYQADMGEAGTDEAPVVNEPSISKLIKAGILTERLRFASPMAERFYYRNIFPRALPGTDYPESIDQLIIETTGRLSARRLRTARQEKPGVLLNAKEAVYQQLFHEAIASLLPVSFRIIPELGTKAEVDGKIVTGELDFYIKNGRKWALELLRDGSRLGEHLGRIPGKYKDVEATAWLVVDCRMDVKPTKKEDDLCSLVFSKDFKLCQCYMRLSEEPLEIELAD